MEVAGLIVAVLLVAIGGIGWYASRAKSVETSGAQAGDSNRPLSVELVKDSSDSLNVPEAVQKSVGIIGPDGKQKIAIAHVPIRTRPLEMLGSTALDPARLIRIRVRFAPADVSEIAKIVDPHSPIGSTTPPTMRELQDGDKVKKGQLLAVLRSVDVGNKKNDLFDALSQQKLDEEVLKRAEENSAAVPEVFLLNAKRNVEADVNAVNRAENTLRTWAIPEADIQAVRSEAKQIKDVQEKRKHEKESLEQWSRVELTAPADGVIIEQNVAEHETIVDNTTNLLQIARVDQLLVIAAVPEDDLPALHELQVQTQGRIPWTVSTVGAAAVNGFIDDIGYLIDPNQHTAVVRGHILNPDGALRGGQLASAMVELLPPKNVVEIPMNAVVDDGRESIVFVQKVADSADFTERRVAVTNRFEKTAFVRSAPLTKEALTKEAAAKEDTANENTANENSVQSPPPALPIMPLVEGERVLTCGALELKAALADKLSEKLAKETQAKGSSASPSDSSAADSGGKGN